MFRVNISDDACWIACNHCIGWHRFGDHRARADDGIAADVQALHDGGSCADRASRAQVGGQGGLLLPPALLGICIGKCGVGADDDLILNTKAIPKLHATVDSHAITDDHIAFDERVRAHVASSANFGAVRDNGVLPEACVGADVFRLNIGQFVNEDAFH